MDPRVLENQDLKEKTEAAWKPNRGQSDSISPEDYFWVWKEIRAIVKDAQYQEYTQLSELDQKRKKLKQLSDLANNALEGRHIEAVDSGSSPLWQQAQDD
ncbi:hypothetical protein R1sor_003445 [Riccia sorocarpa]|uniref:Uncharacterized protein n=1 Tax=Riccia sorocarpa TaxID=122646 RepID=A0ABD3H202_9MARC